MVINKRSLVEYVGMRRFDTRMKRQMNKYTSSSIGSSCVFFVFKKLQKFIKIFWLDPNDDLKLIGQLPTNKIGELNSS